MTMTATEYMRARRSDRADVRLADKHQSLAYSRALRRLRDRYRNVFDRYYTEEKGRFGNGAA